MSAGGGKLPQLCDATDVCAKCGAMAVTSKCSRCLRVCYCNKQCQEKHWSVHKKICKTPAQQEAGAGQQEHRSGRLYNASLDGDLPTVRALIAEGADVNWASPETRGTPLHVASLNGRLSVVNALIAARAVVDRVDAKGFTALMLAAQEGREAIVSVLHRVAGASLHHVNNQGFTAMPLLPSMAMLESCEFFSEREITRLCCQVIGVAQRRSVSPAKMVI